MRLVPDRVIDGRYRLERLIGRGGMGVVWLAHDVTLNRYVALKFISELLAHDRAAIDDLKVETNRCLELTHPRIVRIYDFVQDADLAGISMEYIAGDTLSGMRILQPHRVFAPEALHSWLRQLGEALQYAHAEAKVIHRDLKPTNLLIDSTGTLKVSDFGISRSITDSLTRVSGSTKVTGTLGYMSPQQAQGMSPTPSDDIYAIGATIFELLAGKPPFHGQPALVFQQLINIPAPSVNARRREFTNGQASSIPMAWEDTISRCLAKESASRPASVLEVIERLNSPSPTTIGVGSASPVTELPSARRSNTAFGWFIVLGAILALSLGTYFGLTQSSTNSSTQATPVANTPVPPPTPVIVPRTPSPPPETPRPSLATPVPAPEPVPSTPVPVQSTPVPATPKPQPTPRPVVQTPTRASTPVVARKRATETKKATRDTEPTPRPVKATPKPKPKSTPKATDEDDEREARPRRVERAEEIDRPESTPRPQPVVQSTPRPQRSEESEAEKRRKQEIIRRAVEKLRGPGPFH